MAADAQLQLLLSRDQVELASIEVDSRVVLRWRAGQEEQVTWNETRGDKAKYVKKVSSFDTFLWLLFSIK